MPGNRGNLRFQASAHLQRLIGRELISVVESAVVELVKNPYDAGATKVLITIRPQSEKEPGEIVIVDDGEGMDREGFGRLFMTAGYSERDPSGTDGGRVPTGEKGIGRFAVDRLGHHVDISTKPKGESETLHVSINWDKFNTRSKRFNDVTVPYHIGPDARFSRPSASGTVLVIRRLRDKWDRERIKKLRERLSDLLDPYRSPSTFSIDIQVPGWSALSGPVIPEHVEDADLQLNFKILSDGRFNRHLNRQGQPGTPKECLDATETSKMLKGLRGKFFYYLKPPKKQQRKSVSPAVHLYRDGFKIQPFAGADSDWLGVKEHREKRAGHAHIVPTRLFGFVAISRKNHPELSDTSSRESLIDTQVTQSLVTFLKQQLKVLEEAVRVEHSEPRWVESRTKQVAESEQARLQTLSIMSSGIAHEMRQPLQAIQSDAGNIRRRLELLKIEDQIINDAQANIDRCIQRIDGNITGIARISSGRLDDIEQVDLAEVIQEQCELLRPRCAQEDVALVGQIPRSQDACVNRATVHIVLTNLIQNSLDAITAAGDCGGGKGEIVVSLCKDGTNVFEVTDNGPGIDSDVKPKIFTRFTTKKTGGWGLGLYNCKLLVQAHGGDISFITRSSVGARFRVSLPDTRPKK